MTKASGGTLSARRASVRWVRVGGRNLPVSTPHEEPSHRTIPSCSPERLAARKTAARLELSSRTSVAHEIVIRSEALLTAAKAPR